MSASALGYPKTTAKSPQTATSAMRRLVFTLVRPSVFFCFGHHAAIALFFEAHSSVAYFDAISG
jgi:hypothetical protein